MRATGWTGNLIFSSTYKAIYLQSTILNCARENCNDSGGLEHPHLIKCSQA